MNLIIEQRTDQGPWEDMTLYRHSGITESVTTILRECPDGSEVTIKAGETHTRYRMARPQVKAIRHYANGGLVADIYPTLGMHVNGINIHDYLMGPDRLLGDSLAFGHPDGGNHKYQLLLIEEPE